LDFKVKRQDGDPDPSLVVSTTTVLNPTNGTAKTTIAAAQMAGLTDGDYRHALWRTNSGAKTCLSQGFFSVGNSTL